MFPSFLCVFLSQFHPLKMPTWTIARTWRYETTEAGKIFQVAVLWRQVRLEGFADIRLHHRLLTVSGNEVCLYGPPQRSA